MAGAAGEGPREWRRVTDLLKLYHHLPYPAKVLAASFRGLQLRSWRYGAETPRLVEEALARDGWSAERWRCWIEERLAFVLHRAATRVPYYREYWQRRRRGGDRTDWEVLGNWPILDKEAVRVCPPAFVADDCTTGSMFHEHTSGTTGKSLDLWWSRGTVRQWYALFEARCRNWHGVSRDDNWAILGGQLVAPVARRKPPFWVWNAPMRQLYLSSYHLTAEYASLYFDALVRHGVRYLWGYPSALHILAQEALRLGRTDLCMTVVFTNAEPLLQHQRETIGEAFGCAVRETYGMAEIVTAASECAAGTLHVWPEVGVAEVRDGERAAAPGETGELVCTGLLNWDMPLVRYRVGDRGALEVTSPTCTCGRTLPRLLHLEGRSDDVLYTPDGRRVGRLDPVFKSRLPVREAQIIQEAPSRLRVRYVPAAGYDSRSGDTIVKRLRERVGEVEVILDEVAAIPRTANGKFRAVVCNLSPAEIAALTRATAVHG